MKNIPSIRVIKESRLDAVIHTKTKREAIMLVKILGVDKEGLYDENDFIECWNKYKEDTCYRIRNGKVDRMDCVEFYQRINAEIYELSDLFGTGGTVSIHDMPTSEWSKLEFKNDSSIEAIPKEEKNLKFTFYVTEGTRPDKKCNGLIPTMTTTVIDASGKKATVTCDKADYSERQGVLEAIAQLACGGNFDKEYDKAVKKNKLIELHDRTCIYCGKIFDTAEERAEHEKWHVERKKARRERYLLRKRAKEIAFEEQAQKIAKEMITEGNKK